MLELYHSGHSTHSVKVRLTLSEKALDYVSHFISIRDNEHLTDAYLAINPHGVVPTLIHDGAIITETTTINEYLEDVFPEVKLRPDDPAARAKMRNVGKVIDEYIRAGTGIYNWKARRANNVAAYSEAEYQQALARVDEPIKRRLYLGARAGGYAEEVLAAHRELTAWGVKELERALADGPWMIGEMYSLADINALASVAHADEHAPDLIGPRLRAWLTRMHERPAVKAVLAPSDEAPSRTHYGESGSIL